MSGLLKRWNEFWFAETSTESMALLRVFYGIAAICKCTGLWGLHKTSWGMSFPSRRTAPIEQGGDLFRDPVPGFDWIPSISSGQWNTWEAVGMFAAMLWTVGFATRVSGWVLLLYFAVPMLHSRFDYWHHSANFALFMAIFAVAPTGDHYSLDRFIYGAKDIPHKRPIWALRLVQFLLTWVYISTLLGKMNMGWFDGTILRVMDEGGMLKGPFKPLILSVVDTFALSWITLISQAAFVAFIWTRYRRLAWFFGANLHIGIDMLMNVTTFSMQMIALYVAFISPSSKMTRVCYDGDDEIARARARFGMLLDWFDRIDWIDTTQMPSRGSPKGAPPTKRGIVLERPDGTRSDGIVATSEIFGLLPATFLFSFVLFPLVFVCRRLRIGATTWAS